MQSGTHRSGREIPFNEWHNKGTQTTIYVESNIVCFGEFRETWDIIHVSVGEIGSRTNNLKGYVERLRESLSFQQTIIVFGFLLEADEEHGLYLLRRGTHMALLTLATSTVRVIGSTGILWSLTFRYAAPLSNAVWADAGMTLKRR